VTCSTRGCLQPRLPRGWPDGHALLAYRVDWCVRPARSRIDQLPERDALRNNARPSRARGRPRGNCQGIPIHGLAAPSMSLNVGDFLLLYQGRWRCTGRPSLPAAAYPSTVRLSTNHAIGCARSTLRAHQTRGSRRPTNCLLPKNATSKTAGVVKEPPGPGPGGRKSPPPCRWVPASSA
jgi:hypothetical protein